MVDDLKQQASELYKERSPTDAIPTSDSHSMKKIVYLSLGLGILLILAVYLWGGFAPRKNPVVAANTPPPLVKEAPPEELMKPEGSTPAPPTGNSQAPDTGTTSSAAKPPAAAGGPETKSAKESERELEPPRERPKAAKLAARKEPAAAPVAPEPEPPKLSDIEIARRELARDIIIQKNPGLAKLISGGNDKNWTAEPEGADVYQVTFNVVDDSTGSQVQYVWRVNLSDKSITPLSYYARRLS
jgi:hypothetical protein